MSHLLISLLDKELLKDIRPSEIYNGVRKYSSNTC